MIENVHISPLGPPGPTENDFLMHGVVMFGLEMLGLVLVIENVMFGSSNRLKYTFFAPGPDMAHRRCLSVNACSHIWFRNVRLS